MRGLNRFRDTIPFDTNPGSGVSAAVDELASSSRITGGNQDMLKFLVKQAWKFLRSGDRAGFVAPWAIYNNEGCTGLRHLRLEKTQV